MKIFPVPPELGALLAALEYFRDKPYAGQVPLDFHRDVIQGRYANAAKYAALDKGAPLSTATVVERLKAGFSILDEASVVVDNELSGELFDEFCELLARHQIVAPEGAADLAARRRDGEIDPAALVRSIIGQTRAFFDTLAEGTASDPALLAFIAENVARPVLAGSCAGLDVSVEAIGLTRSTCPCCGNEPVMAMFAGEEGRRVLKCSLCHTCWEFPRMECPFCRSTNPSSLKFLYYDIEDPHRVYVCEECRRYVRTVDERKSQNRTLVLEAEVLATGYLDTLAQKQGYLRLGREGGLSGLAAT